MNWKQFLQEQRELTALLGVLGAQELDAYILKVAYAKRVFPEVGPGEPIPWKDVLTILEDEELGLAEREACSILEGSGLAQKRDGALIAPDEIRVRAPFLDLPSNTLTVTRSEFLGLLAPGRRPVDDGKSSAITASAAAGALARTRGWGIRIARETLVLGKPGVPPFWRPQDGGYTPFFPDPGALTTSDTLRLPLEPLRYGACLPALGPEECSAIIGLWERLLALQVREGWNRGAVKMPAADDDFTGSYSEDTPELVELGACPTTDATGGAVIALCVALASGLGHLADAGEASSLVARTRWAIVAGVRFLLQSQLQGPGDVPAGPWPLYRYEERALDRRIELRNASDWYAVEALAQAVRSGILDDALGSAARDAAQHFLDFVEGTAKQENDACAWLPSYVTPYARPQEMVLPTTLTALALTHIVETWDDLAPRAFALVRSAIAFLARRWRPNPEGFGRITFRVPRWDGPADAAISWEWPLDPLVVPLLTRAERLGVRIDRELEDQIVSAIAGVIGTEQDGYWIDFLMKQRGNLLAMPPNTLKYQIALLEFVARERRILEGFFAGRES